MVSQTSSVHLAEEAQVSLKFSVDFTSFIDCMYRVQLIFGAFDFYSPDELSFLFRESSINLVLPLSMRFQILGETIEVRVSITKIKKNRLIIGLMCTSSL